MNQLLASLVACIFCTAALAQTTVSVAPPGQTSSAVAPTAAPAPGKDIKNNAPPARKAKSAKPKATPKAKPKAKARAKAKVKKVVKK